MYFSDFEVFFQASEAMFVSNPEKTRYVFKYRACEGHIVLKVTDNVKCLKFKTNKHDDLKQIERMNLLFLRHSTSSK